MLIPSFSFICETTCSLVHNPLIYPSIGRSALTPLPGDTSITTKWRKSPSGRSRSRCSLRRQSRKARAGRPRRRRPAPGRGWLRALRRRWGRPDRPRARAQVSPTHWTTPRWRTWSSSPLAMARWERHACSLASLGSNSAQSMDLHCCSCLLLFVQRKIHVLPLPSFLITYSSIRSSSLLTHTHNKNVQNVINEKLQTNMSIDK